MKHTIKMIIKIFSLSLLDVSQHEWREKWMAECVSYHCANYRVFRMGWWYTTVLIALQHKKRVSERVPATASNVDITAIIYGVWHCPMFFFIPPFYTGQRHDEVHRAEQHEMSTTSQYIFHDSFTLMTFSDSSCWLDCRDKQVVIFPTFRFNGENGENLKFPSFSLSFDNGWGWTLEMTNNSFSFCLAMSVNQSENSNGFWIIQLNWLSVPFLRRLRLPFLYSGLTHCAQRREVNQFVMNHEIHEIFLHFYLLKLYHEKEERRRSEQRSEKGKVSFVICFPSLPHFESHFLSQCWGKHIFLFFFLQLPFFARLSDECLQITAEWI